MRKIVEKKIAPKYFNAGICNLWMVRSKHEEK